MIARILTILAGLAFMVAGCSSGGGGPTDRVCFILGCANLKISVNAGPDQTVISGNRVELRGGVNSGSLLNYAWRQLAGPAVTLSGSDQLTASFKAPVVEAATTLTFRLTVAKSGKKISDDVNIVVLPTSASAVCLQAPLYATSFAWTSSGCTTSSSDIVGDSRVATIYRQSEAEPNSSLQNANLIVFPSSVSKEPPAADVSGSIDGASGDSSDFYIFTPPSSGDYHVYACNDPLVCTRSTVSGDWYLEVYDQDLNVIARTQPGVPVEQTVMLRMDAGLPYYVGVIASHASLEYWQYNLTVILD